VRLINDDAKCFVRACLAWIAPLKAFMSSSRRDRLVAESLSLLYIGLIAAISVIAAFPYLLFPELGALCHDVLTRPGGKWASQPWRLIAPPTLTGAIGTLLSRHAPYSYLTVLIDVALSMLVIAILRSAIAPAMSASALPIVLGLKSWLYPPSILAGLIILAVTLTIYRRYCGARYSPSVNGSATDIDDVLESTPRGRYWVLAFLAFVAVTGLVAQFSGLRFILFPPLITIAYEMFGHPETCPWLKNPVWFPVCCFLTALGGLISFKIFGLGALGAVCAMGVGVLLLRVFDVHMPLALAVALLPFVMTSPDMRYPASVGIGTLVLTGFFLMYQRGRGSLAF
jgi:hypothetical protein